MDNKTAILVLSGELEYIKDEMKKLDKSSDWYEDRLIVSQALEKVIEMLKEG